jgi:hypothetical protein
MEISVLAGGQTPSVLRRNKLVGKAYINGIMFGTAVVGKEDNLVSIILE